MRRLIAYLMIGICTVIAVGGIAIVWDAVQKQMAIKAAYREILNAGEIMFEGEGVLYEVPTIGIKKIKTDFQTEHIKVEAADQDSMTIEHREDVVFNQENPLIIYTNGHTLYIKRQKTFWDFLFQVNYPTSKVVIRIPTNLGLELDLDTVSGDVLARHVKNDSLKLTSVSGNIEIEDVETETLKVETVSGSQYGNAIVATEIETESVSGNQKFEAIESCKEIQSETVSGDYNIEMMRIAEEIAIETVSGDVNIGILRGEGFELAYETVSGELQTNIPFQITKQSDDELGGIYQNNMHSVAIETVSGDCLISFIE